MFGRPLAGITYGCTWFIQIANGCRLSSPVTLQFLPLSSVSERPSERTVQTLITHTAISAAGHLQQNSDWLMQTPRGLWVNYWTHTFQRENHLGWKLRESDAHSSRRVPGCSSLTCSHLHPTMGGTWKPCLRQTTQQIHTFPLITLGKWDRGYFVQRLLKIL